MKDDSRNMDRIAAPRTWQLAHGRSLDLGAGAVVMGILNVTPDSFSDGGRFNALDAAVARAARMAGEGAAIIDVGGESTRPGADPVDAAEEQARILPVIEALAARGDILISVDTYRAGTAERAIAAGAHIVNDVWGLQKDRRVAEIAAATGAGLVIMHTGREREKMADPLDDQLSFLRASLNIAEAAGVAADRIMLDPGFGFGKETADNLALLAGFRRLMEFSDRWLVGTSRKRFLGAVTGREADRRDAATVATSVVLRMAGACVFRVHDVAANIDALKLADAVLAAARPEGIE